MELPAGMRTLLLARDTVPVGNIIRIPLFENKVAQHSFQSFLIEDRFRPTQILQALRELGMERNFFIGYEEISLWEGAREEGEPDTSSRVSAPRS